MRSTAASASAAARRSRARAPRRAPPRAPRRARGVAGAGGPGGARPGLGRRTCGETRPSGTSQPSLHGAKARSDGLPAHSIGWRAKRPRSTTSPVDPVREVADAHAPVLGRAPTASTRPERRSRRPAVVRDDVGLEEAEVAVEPARQARAHARRTRSRPRRRGRATSIDRRRRPARSPCAGRSPSASARAPGRSRARGGRSSRRARAARRRGSRRPRSGGSRRPRPPAWRRRAPGRARSGTISSALWSRPSPTRNARFTPGTSASRRSTAAGRDRLAARVLVDVLHAVDDLEVAARPPHEDVAGRRASAPRPAPARRVVEVARRRRGPRSAARRSALSRALDAGQRDADRAVLVLARAASS